MTFNSSDSYFLSFVAFLKMQYMYWQLPLWSWVAVTDITPLTSTVASPPLAANNVGLTIYSPPPSAPQGYFGHQIRGYMWGCFLKAAYKWETESFILLFVKLRSLWSSQLVTDTVQFAVAYNSLSKLRMFLPFFPLPRYVEEVLERWTCSRLLEFPRDTLKMKVWFALIFKHTNTLLCSIYKASINSYSIMPTQFPFFLTTTSFHFRDTLSHC